ncbi:MAG: hypothetical protein N2663_07990 [Chlorobi bacterium]|nr:hypothetical protein [Chlorobiota bacterium]
MERVILWIVSLCVASVIASAQIGSVINYGAIIKDSMRLDNSAAFMRLPINGTIRWGDPAVVGMLQSSSLSVGRTWTLPDEKANTIG